MCSGSGSEVAERAAAPGIYGAQRSEHVFGTYGNFERLRLLRKNCAADGESSACFVSFFVSSPPYILPIFRQIFNVLEFVNSTLSTLFLLILVFSFVTTLVIFLFFIFSCMSFRRPIVRSFQKEEYHRFHVRFKIRDSAMNISID